MRVKKRSIMKVDNYMVAYGILSLVYIVSTIIAMLYYIITLDRKDLATIATLTKLDMVGVFLIWIIKLTEYHYLIGYDIFWLSFILCNIIGLYIRRNNNDRRDL